MFVWNEMSKSSVIPDIYKYRQINFIPKGKHSYKLKDKRSISISQPNYAMVEACAMQEGRSPQDLMSILRIMVDNCRLKGICLVMFIADIQKAFDNVDYFIIW